MIAFKRLSTGPTLPDLIRKEADRRAQRSLHLLPANVWLRPATAAVCWHHRNNGLMPESGGMHGKVGDLLSGSEFSHTRSRGMDAAPRPCPARMRERAIARSYRAAEADLAACKFRTWQCRAGMAACFTGANGVLAMARLLNWCRLLSPDGIGAALAGADQLTRAGMRFWKISRLGGRP